VQSTKSTGKNQKKGSFSRKEGEETSGVSGERGRGRPDGRKKKKMEGKDTPEENMGKTGPKGREKVSRGEGVWDEVWAQKTLWEGLKNTGKKSGQFRREKRKTWVAARSGRKNNRAKGGAHGEMNANGLIVPNL